MKMLTDLAEQLGLNSTFYWQLALSLAFLYFSRVFLFDKLYRILTLRLKQTVGAQASSVSMDAEVQVLQKQYEKSLQEKLESIQNNYSQTREQMMKSFDQKRAQQEELLQTEQNSKMKELRQMFENMEHTVNQNSMNLSHELLLKFKI